MRKLIFYLLRPCIDYYLLLKKSSNLDIKRRNSIADQIRKEHNL